jgi:hypothetical protein
VISYEQVRPVVVRARQLAASPWSAVVVAGVVVLLLVVAWNRSRSAAGELARHLEAEQLRAAGLEVAGEKAAADLWEEANRASAENEDLRRALEEARKAANGERPVLVVRSSTGPTPVSGAARPGAVACPDAPAPPATPPLPVCLLAAGDQGEVLVDEIVLETRGGNRILVGAASAWRASPARARLFGGTFNSELGQVDAAAPASEPGWGAGVWAGVSREGWALGPALALPPLRLWSLQLEATLGAGLGPGGVWQGGGTAVARW